MEGPRKPEVEVEIKEPIIAAAPAEPVVQPEPAKKEADHSEELAKLRREKEEAEARWQEGQRKITEIANEKATLEQRLAETTEKTPDPTIRQEVEDALSIAQLDPAKGAERLTALMERTNQKSQKDAVTEALRTVEKQQRFKQEFDTYVNKVRTDNPQLKRYENVIARIAADKMQLERKPYNVAIDEAVKEFGSLREQDIKEAVGASPAPKGSQGESSPSGQRPLEAAAKAKEDEPDPESDADYVAKRRAAQGKRI